MKPVIIFRFLGREGPGYLGAFLDEQKIPWRMVKVDEGEPIPASLLANSGMACSGIVLMGGPMSVNDDLPWIAPLMALIREARAVDIPLLGHCLGGQLISKALGGVVTQNAIKEIGWGEVNVTENETAEHWFGAIKTFNAFHWHGETFSLPAGATHLLASPYCQNQAYAIGKHVAFQTHIEMTTEMVKKWCDEGADEMIESASSPAVQNTYDMQKEMPVHCFFLNKVAKQVYSQWIKGLIV